MSKEIMTVKEIMENKELANYIAESIEDIPADAPVKYALWAIGYTEGSAMSDKELLLGEFTDPDKAIAVANETTFADVIHKDAEEYNGEAPEDSITNIILEVETVVDTMSSEGTVNIGTIYRRELPLDDECGVEIDTEEPVRLSDEDYTLLDDGTLKIKCPLLKGYNKNDTVRFFFDEEDYDRTPILTYKIVSKVEYEDGDYYHCEFIG